jgi:hypothetical protein
MYARTEVAVTAAATPPSQQRVPRKAPPLVASTRPGSSLGPHIFTLQTTDVAIVTRQRTNTIIGLLHELITQNTNVHTFTVNSHQNQGAVVNISTQD